MDDSQREERTRQIVAESERLIAEAREALAAGDRFFAEHGIDPDRLMDYVRRAGGERAVQNVEAEVERSMRKIREEAERRFQHMQFEHQPARRSRRLRNLV